jgi:PAS domain S-box-containing protein
MRKRLFKLILISILTTAAVISLIIGKFSLDFARKIFMENIEGKISRIEKQFAHYESILSTVEQEMSKSGTEALKKLANSFPDEKSSSRIAPEKLKEFANKIGVSDVYFIGHDGTVYNSSLVSDINLNLLNSGPAFSKFINSLYGKGETASQGISTSIKEGKISYYMYYSPKKSNIIYEISLDVQKFIEEKYNFALYEFLFSDMFKNFYDKYLISIDVYSIVSGNSWSIINPGKKLNISQKHIDELLSKGDASFEKDNKIYHYHKIKMNKFFFNRKSSIYIELIYDSKIFCTYATKVIVFSIFSCILITVIIFLLTTKKINDVLLERISKVTSALEKIKNGNFNVAIKDNENDELSEISTNINKLAETLNQNLAEIRQKNSNLIEMSTFINNIIESMPSALIATDFDDRITQWNKEAELLSDFTSLEAKGKNIWEVLPQIYKYKSIFDEVKSKRIKAELIGETYIKESCGKEEVFIKNIYMFPFTREDIYGVIIRIDDVTELARKEALLERAKQAEILGTMASGLAHDFNNIIAGIISTASYLNVIAAAQNPDIEEIKSTLSTIIKSGEKAATLVKNLMSFAKNKEITKTPVDLKRSISDVATIAQNAIRNNITLSVNLPDEDEAIVMGDKVQLGQIMLNLIVNSSEAIPETIEGKINIILKKEIRRDLPTENKNNLFWHITVEDNGTGIDQEHLKKIFDPFFTTKKEDNGLGLAIVNTIITKHDGFIEVNSQKGMGTNFHIYLPSFE